MSKQFKFSPAQLSSLPPNPPSSRSTEAEYSDTDVSNKGTPIKLDKPQILFYAKSSYQGNSEDFS